MSKKITEKDMKEVTKMVKKEFPNDPALQQVHIARKIIAKEAELAGMQYFEYLKLQKDRTESLRRGEESSLS